MAHERIDRGLPPPKSNERLERRPAAAYPQYLSAEPFPGLGAQDTHLLEQAIGVGGQNFRPFVAVVARRIAPGKDVGKAVREPVIFRRDDQGDALADLREQSERRDGAGGLEV